MTDPPSAALLAPMDLGDLEEVLAIEGGCFPSPWPRELFVEELARPNAYLTVLRERAGAPVVAFVNYWVVDDEVHLLQVATRHQARRRGFGAHLVGHVVEAAVANRCRHVTLEVRPSNGDAVRLYQRFGFRVVGRRKSYYRDDGEDALVMLLDRGVVAG